MKNLMKKKVNLFGKKISVFVIALFAVAIVSAALLSYFGMITGSVIVSQGLLVDGKSMPESGQITEIWEPFTSLEEKTFVNAHYLENKATVDAVLELVKDCDDTDGTTIAGYESGEACEDITTSYYELKTLEDTRNEEKFWCNLPCVDLIPLVEEQLEVSVSYEDSYVVFKAIPPSSYNLETSGTTFTFDSDSDGVAEFQIQYRGDSDGWKYSGADDWLKDDSEKWQSVPSEFDTDLTEREFTLEVPMSVLGGLGSNYKFGVQANGEPSHQIFYSTDARHLWYDTEYADYVHSTYYVEMTLGTALTSPFTVPTETTLDFVIVNEFPKMMKPDTYTITTTVLPTA